jgi:hypothetical protein
LGDSIAAANSSGSQGVDPANPYDYRGSGSGITNWRGNTRPAEDDGAIRVDGMTFTDDMEMRRITNNPYGLPSVSIESSRSATTSGDTAAFDDGANMAQRGFEERLRDAYGPALLQGVSGRTPESAAELHNRAQELRSRANQLADAAEWARSRGMAAEASTYQQAANKAYYDGQRTLVQAVETNSQEADSPPNASPVGVSQGPLPAGWNMRDASAAANSTPSTQAPAPAETEFEYRIRLARGPQLTALPAGDPYERTRANLGMALAGTTVAAAIAVPTTAASLSAAGAVYSTVGPLGTAGIGAATSGGMDVAMQYYSTGTVRPAQTAFAATIGAISGPVGATSGPLTNFVLGSAGATLNTGFQNIYYGDNKSLTLPALVGGSFGILGYYSGARIATGLSLLRPESYYANLNRGMPALFQPRSINTVPASAGATIGGIASGLSPLGEDAANYLRRPSPKK